jgi:hypothetical protein
MTPDKLARLRDKAKTEGYHPVEKPLKPATATLPPPHEEDWF